MDGVVPLAMEFVTGDAEAGHLLIGYDNSLWIGARVEFAADGKPGLCCGGADEIDDHTIADQRLRLPERISIGGRQRLALHELPGGGRVIDVIGPDEAPIRWSGTFSDTDAADRVRVVEQLRRAGDPL